MRCQELKSQSPSLSGLPPRVDRQVAGVCLFTVAGGRKSLLNGFGQYLIMDGTELLKVVSYIGLLPCKVLRRRRGEGARRGERFPERGLQQERWDLPQLLD